LHLERTKTCSPNFQVTSYQFSLDWTTASMDDSDMHPKALIHYLGLITQLSSAGIAPRVLLFGNQLPTGFEVCTGASGV